MALFATIQGDTLLLHRSRPEGDCPTINGPYDLAYQFQIHQNLREVSIDGHADWIGATNNQSVFDKYFV